MDQPKTFLQRLQVHARFYVPAFIALFFSFPESRCLFSADYLFLESKGELFESFLIVSFFLSGYIASLVIPNNLSFRVLAVSILNIALFSVNFSRIRGAAGYGSALGYLFESSAFAVYIPLFFLSYVLIAVENIKRSPRVIYSVYGLIIVLVGVGFSSRDSAGVLDRLIARDVRERMQQQDYDSEQEIVAECQKMASERNRSRCVNGIAVNSSVPFCPWEEGDDRTECLSQIAMAKQTGNTLKKCDETETGEGLQSCYARLFFGFNKQKDCEQLAKRNWVLACQKAFERRIPDQKLNADPVTATINR